MTQREGYSTNPLSRPASAANRDVTSLRHCFPEQCVHDGAFHFLADLAGLDLPADPQLRELVFLSAYRNQA